MRRCTWGAARIQASLRCAFRQAVIVMQAAEHRRLHNASERRPRRDPEIQGLMQSEDGLGCRVPTTVGPYDARIAICPNDLCWRKRGEALNATNTPHFSNPGANGDNLQRNSDGSIRSLNGFSTIT